MQYAKVPANPGWPSYATDAALFDGETVVVSVELTPQRRRTRSGDLALRAFIADKEIEVVFAGRRQTLVVPLLKHLVGQSQSTPEPVHEAESAKPIKAARGKVLVEGTWRTRVWNTQAVRPSKRFQLVAARWRYRGVDGVDRVFGNLPPY